MYQVAVLVSSDRAYKGVYEDKSGAYLKEKMTLEGYDVVCVDILPDEIEALKAKLLSYVERGIHLVLTTGGTGLAERDVMPEATKQVVERETPGISEAIRMQSLAVTPHAMLSRAVSGIRKKTWIINLPGSRKAVEESISFILGALPHGLGILNGTMDN